MAFREGMAWHKRRGSLPRRKSLSNKDADDVPAAEEDVLAQKLIRWGRSRNLTPAARKLKARLDRMAARSDAAQRRDHRAAQAEQSLVEHHQEWCQQNDVPDVDPWRRPALQRSCGGRNPYPSLSNICNNCYINAPLQCMLHCPAARAKLLGANGVGEKRFVKDRWSRQAFEGRGEGMGDV